MARLAFRVLLAAADFLSEAVGTKAGSSWEEADERESTGDGSEEDELAVAEEVQDGAMLEVERLRLGTVGICNPGRVGELRAESGVSLPELVVSALEGELARSSESSREAGEMGVIGIRANRSSGAMQVGCWNC